MDLTAKYPEVEVILSDGMVDGNAVAIMMKVARAMRRANIPSPEIDAFLVEAKSGNYDHMLQTCMRWVTVS